MAGTKKSSDDNTNDGEKRASMDRWADARREDLAEAIGLIILPPPHGADASGEVKFGIRPEGGLYNPDVVERYVSEAQELVQSTVYERSQDDQHLRERSGDIVSNPYSVGPAAQEWPKYLFLIYESGQHVLDDALRLYGAAQIVREVVKRLHRHDEKIAEDPSRSADVTIRYPSGGAPSTEVAAGILLTPGGLVSLCVMDAFDHYDTRDNIDVEIHTRSWSGYSTQGHPGSSDDIHTVRITESKRELYWVVQTDGRVLEHFSVENQKMTQLPLPEWFDDSSWRTSYFQTETSYAQLKMDIDEKGR